MKKENLILTLGFIIILLIIITSTILINQNKEQNTEKIIGNTSILSEIDKLLLPLSTQNITESDFNKLKDLTKNDGYASSEVNELIILTKYKEYSHIGHGLGFLYEYIKTGKQPICPGHNLAHYYIFKRHDEINLAEENLKEAKEYIETLPVDYDQSYKTLFEKTIQNIDSRNNTTSDDKISNLSEAPCIK